MRSSAARVVLLAAILLGTAARVGALVIRPLWADEIFTLTLTKKSVPEILAALRVDSGPPLHYLLAHVLLAPFGPAPGPADVLVRVLSLVASLLHLPLLVVVARRLDRPALGLPAAALFAIFPLAVAYAAEGRAYALASLLTLVAFERALALRERPRLAVAAGLTLAASGAVLTHYLAVFPVAALAVLAWGARPASRRALVASGFAAAVLAAPWAPTALHQPRTAMAWLKSPEFGSAPVNVLVNLAFGADPQDYAPGITTALRIAAAALLAFVALHAVLRGPRPLGIFVVTAGGLLLAGQVVTGALLLPVGRTAVVFLPFVALLLAAAPPFFVLAAGAVAAAALAHQIPRDAEPSVGELLTRFVEPHVREGRTVCAAGYLGPELSYRLARAGAPGHVLYFPAAVTAHPGWYDEKEIPPETFTREAEVLLASPGRPTLYVLPRGFRASRALASRLAPLKPRRLLGNPLLDVVAIQDSEAR
jgi:Dolichyl-phosphate-mannose-protein mannosyltransferase